MAGRFPPEWVDEVRERSDIVDVVSGYVALKPRGKKYWGLCPFHGEKTPSFSVDAEKQLYYCFGCHAGGNVFHFVMGMERMEFAEAVTHLAERARMPLPQLREDPHYRERMAKRERMAEACRCAARFFHDQLLTAEGKRARDYFQRRGLSDRIVTRFGLGYAPERWDALLGHMERQGYEPAFLRECGLVNERDGRYYDAFRDRAMFPILDGRGKVVAFGGRVLGEGNPKYLNSPESEVFNKRQLLYALNFLKGNSQPRILVVEGYMDVVSLNQYGVNFAVASLGTALTQEQARLLKRMTDRVLLCYDGDAAGQRATLRGMEILAQEGLSVRIVALPEGKDPDEYVRAYGTERFLAELDNAVEPITYRMRRMAENYDMTGQEGRTQYAIEAAKVIAEEENPVARENHLRMLGVQTGFERDVLAEQVETARQNAGKTPQNTGIKNRQPQKRNTKPQKADADIRAEEGLLQMMVGRPDLAQELLKLDAEVFQVHAYRQLFGIMRDLLTEEGDLTPPRVLTRIEDEELATRAAQLFAQDLPEGEAGRYISDCIGRLRDRAVRDKVEGLKQRLAQPDLSGEERKKIVMEIQQALRQMKGNGSMEGGDGSC